MLPLRQLSISKGLGIDTPSSAAPKAGRKKFDAFSLLGKRFAGAKVANGGSNKKPGLSSSSNATSASTSALSHMTVVSSKGNKEPTKLRDDTLRSLGIAVPSRQKHNGSLRSALKKGGDTKGMSRALTMASIREIEVYLPGERCIKRNTSVNFDEKVTIRKVESTSSLAESKSKLWLQDDEMRKIRQRCKSLATMVDHSMNSENMALRTSGDSMRGLERMMPSGRPARSKQKYDAWDSVLDVQEDLYAKGQEYDEEKIASMYRNLSRDSLQQARARGRLDELAIRNSSTTERRERSPRGRISMRKFVRGEA